MIQAVADEKRIHMPVDILADVFSKIEHVIG